MRQNYFYCPWGRSLEGSDAAVIEFEGSDQPRCSSSTSTVVITSRGWSVRNMNVTGSVGWKKTKQMESCRFGCTETIYCTCLDGFLLSRAGLIMCMKWVDTLTSHGLGSERWTLNGVAGLAMSNHFTSCAVIRPEVTSAYYQTWLQRVLFYWSPWGDLTFHWVAIMADRVRGEPRCLFLLANSTTARAVSVRFLRSNRRC